MADGLAAATETLKGPQAEAVIDNRGTDPVFHFVVTVRLQCDQQITVSPLAP